MRKYILLFLIGTLYFSSLHAQQVPQVMGYSAGENVEADGFNVSFSGGAVNFGNGLWKPADMGRVLSGFNPRVVIVPETFTSNLDVSKGYFDNFVDIKWKVATNENVITRFKIFRKKLGESGDSTEVANLSADDRSWRDEYCETGVLYEYTLHAEGIFKEKIKYKNYINGIGFRIPYGVISGRVTFATGSAVEDVEVMAEADEDFSGSSLYLNGTDAYLAVSPDAESTQFDFDDAFTFQAWLKADKTEQTTIFEKGSQYKLSHQNGQLNFTADGQTLALNFDEKVDTFFHVTAMRTADSLKLLVAYDKKISYKSSTELTTVAAKNNNDFYIGKSQLGEYFEGCIDEVRIWNRDFEDEDVLRDARMYISGTEPNLSAYYRFNEAVGGSFYDLSRIGFNFNENHGFMFKAEWSNKVPFSKQLSVKGVTDTNGNYTISGIPYSSTGTNYRFIPVYDVHEFDPSEKLLFMGPGASSHSGINFTDIAAFIVKGNVRYKDTNFPVKGANLYIDDKIVVESSGEPVKTDGIGNYEISVPIGYHTIKVGMLGHVFRKEGYFPEQVDGDDGETTYWNFQEPISGLDFVDTTLVKVIGRVAGGPREESKPKGLGKTVNNIGFGEISLTTQREYDLSDADAGVDSYWTNDMYENEALVNKGETRHIIEALSPKNIKIIPDKETGEFVAYLLPEKYLITGVKAGDYIYPESFKTTVDLTRKYLTNTEIDSVQIGLNVQPSGDTIYDYRIDSIRYKHNLDLIYREIPSVAVSSKDDNPVFWETEITAKNDSVVSLINEDGSLKTSYPIFRQRGVYDLKVSVFENYINKDKANAEDKVPVVDGNIEIQNALAMQKDLISLPIDNFGNAYYSFKGGLPNITSGGIGDYLLSMSVVARTGKNGAIATPWEFDGDVFKAYLFGGMPTGSNFVSTGPNELITVLRDPPGSGSYAYLEKGAEFNTTKSSSISNEFAAEANLTISLGNRTSTWAGVGGGTIIETGIVADASAGIQGGYAWGSEGEQSVSLSNTQVWSTSDSEDFVGAAGDVYVGYSTNIVYGVSTQVELIPTDMPQGSGFVGKNFDQHGVSYDIGISKGIRVNPEFGTMFQYTQSHIKDFLIPNLMQLRNNYLQSHENYSCVICNKEDEDYGTNNSSGSVDINGYTGGDIYNYSVPADWDVSTIYVDSIKFYNEQIKDWEYVLAQNEKAKLNAELDQNISFDGGTVYESSQTTENSTTETRSYEWNLGGSIGAEIGGDVMGIGTTLTMETSYNHGESNATSTSETNAVTYGYVLNDGNAGDYLSVDVKKAKKPSGPIFVTRGGQTMCPYEGGEYTEYYQPGTLLNEATMQREVPQIACENPLQVNVPEDNAALFNVQLSNASESDDDQWLILGVDEASNQNGAVIKVDGETIYDGKMVLIPAGETINKVLTVEKTLPDVYEYQNLAIVLQSACQSDISDTVKISTSFQPVCTNVDIVSLEDKWVLNTNGDTTLTVGIGNYDLQNNGFNKILLQYKSSSTSNWGTEMVYYVDEDEYNNASEPKGYIDGQAAVEYVFDWSSMQDRTYNIKVSSQCVDGTSNDSEILTGIKDVKRPMVFGTPQPADGILSAGDDIIITYDEPINAGLLLPYNFAVKGVLNGNEIKHQSCVYFDGKDDYATAAKGVNLDGKSWTIEFWLKRGDLSEGVVLSQSGIEIGFDAANKFYLTAGSQSIVSESAIEDTELWKHYAVTFNHESRTFNMFINDNIEREVVPQESAFNGDGKMYIAKSAVSNNPFNGYIHELRIWEKPLGMGTIYGQMYSTLVGNEVGLGSYWPMEEARGTLAADKSRSRNLLFFGCEWRVFPNGYAYVFDGAAHVDFETGASVVIPEEGDFTIEFYFKGGAQHNTVMFSNGKGDGTDISPDFKNIWVIGFNEEGQLYAKNNGTSIIISDEDYLNDSWYHFALVKDEISNATIYIDGKQKAYEQSSLLGGLSGAKMAMGARYSYRSSEPLYDQFFNGQLDEFRIWNLARTKKHLELDMNAKLMGDEMGLVAYYPFDEYNNLGNQLLFTLSDKSAKADPAVATGGDVNNADVPNIKDARPVQEVAFDWVVNNDQVVINMNEQPALVEKCVIEFTMDRVEDMHENRIASPVTWTAYIKQNPVIWNDENIVISKEAYEDYSFDVDIVNTGGTEQNYTISGLPDWLNVSEPDGTIAPDSELTLNFTIDPVVNIGYYDFSLFLESDFGYSEKLNIDLSVLKDNPIWNANPTDYQYSMSVIGQVKVNNVISDDENDLVAAFVNGECRGVTSISYIEEYDFFEVYLNIYSNKPSGEEVELKIWDASEGQIITDVKPEIVFQNNDLLGSPSQPVDIIASVVYEAHIALNAGWTWVSFNLDSEALQYNDSLFYGVDLSNKDMIKSATAFDIYSNTSNSWFGTLVSNENIQHGKNYMIKTARNNELIYSGAHVDGSTLIKLEEGWNWLGYIPLVNMPLNEALSGFTPVHNDIIKSQTAFAVYDELLGWIGSLKFLRSGEGYMYKSQASQSFSYPERGQSLKNSTQNVITDADVWKLNRSEYSNNMSVIAKVNGDDFSRENLVLAAFCGDECRGVIQPIDVMGDEQFYMTVYGNTESEITFKLLDKTSGKVYQSNESVFYAENKLEGSSQVPLLLSFNLEDQIITDGAKGIEVYPNPFSEYIDMRIPGISSVDMIIISDVVGRTIKTIQPEDNPVIRWDGNDTSNSEVSRGVYLIKVYTGNTVLSKKVVKH